MSPVLSASKLKALYAALLKCRLVKDRFAPGRARAESRACDEAVIVGAAFDLKPGDCIAPSPQSFFAEVVRGQAFNKITAKAASEDGVPGPALQIGMASGLGLALQKQRQSFIALALATIDWTLESVWREALSFSAARKLPVVYVIAHSSARDLRTELEHSIVPAITVDGGDVVAIYRVMQESTRRAREGHGPTVIEARLGAADPLCFMENYLRTRNLWSSTWRDRLIEEVKRELQSAHLRSKGRPS